MIIEPNTKTDFFYVDGEYIEYLKNVAERALLEYKQICFRSGFVN